MHPEPSAGQRPHGRRLTKALIETRRIAENTEVGAVTRGPFALGAGHLIFDTPYLWP